MKLTYDIHEKPKFGQNLVFALQQLLAIIAATLLVPTLVNSMNGGALYMDPPAALFGAGVGTLCYILITRRKSPVFLGSSFAFISPLVGACAYGFGGIILGSLIAGVVYAIISVVMKLVGTAWVNKLLPPVIIGPTVALIGLSLCGSAVNNINNTAVGSYNLWAILTAAITFIATVFAAVKGSRMAKLIPFIIGIGAGYIFAALLTLIGTLASVPSMQLINFSALTSMDSILHVPQFTIVEAVKEGFSGINATSLAAIFGLFAPVAFVVLAEHIGDHKNLSTIIDRDLITDPGLDKTVMGDGVGTIVGSMLGGCPNTTYGECVGCVAITGNASIYTICTTAIMAMILSFFNPFVQLVNTIPVCVIGGICIALYGFIAVSGLKMLQKVDLSTNRNLLVVAAILVPGIGGLTLNLGPITLTNIATALIFGIVTNALLSIGEKKESAEEESAE
ncbi:MAG: uracil-xanthine permease [Clostridia bacterium]|nr:uracil-xanthine permease [Clostridia bacterium]